MLIHQTACNTAAAPPLPSLDLDKTGWPPPAPQDAPSVDQWKAALITLDEAAFFALINGALGAVKSPYNKQNLVEELQSFLSRPEVLRAIDAFIDEDDCEIIRAVALLEQPSMYELFEFLDGGANPAALLRRSSALEERFILYRAAGRDGCRFALNPVLSGVLAPYAGDFSRVLPSFPAAASSRAPRPARAGEGEGFFAGDAAFAALCAFADGQPFFKTDGSLRKKAREDARALCGGGDITPWLNSLILLELSRKNGAAVSPDWERRAAFAALLPYERRVYLAAALSLCSGGPDARAAAEQSAGVYDRAALIHAFLRALSPDRLYPAKTLFRLAMLARRAQRNPRRAALKTAPLLLALRQTGLLRETEGPEGAGFFIPAEACAGKAAKNRADAPAIVFNGSFSFFTARDAPLADMLFLSRFCAPVRPKEPGQSPLMQWEITQDTVTRAFNDNIAAPAIIETLKRLSGGAQDQALVWSVLEWEKRHASVSLFAGLTLCLSSEHQYAIDMEPLKRLTGRRVSAGVLLLNTQNKDEVLAALKECGIENVSRYEPESRAAKAREGAGAFAYTPLPLAPRKKAESPRSKEEGAALFDEGEARLRERQSRARECARRLLEALERMALPLERKEVLKSRIERRLIVSESQLENAHIHEEKMEAGGLDYAGKSNLAKQALETGEVLEIQMNGETESILGRPLSIEKQNNEIFLTVMVLGKGEEAESQTVTVALGKARFLRRVKNAPFL